MRRKLVLALALIALVPMIGCQRVSRLPEIIAKRTGLSSSSPVQQIDSSPTAYSGVSGQLQQRSLSFGGTQRDYFVYAPRSVQNGEPAPMVLALHGGGANASRFADRMGLVNMAEKYGMILVVPQALGRPGAKRGGGSWNANSITPSGYAENTGINDIGFVDALLRSAQGTYSVDPSRVYAMGFSKGGMMAYHAACVLPGRIKAIAAVSATLSARNCPNPQGVSVLHIHGTNDQNVPFNGGVGEFTGGKGNWPAVQRGLQMFSNGNQCSSQPQSTRLSSDTSCTINTCGNNQEVQLCLVQGGGHAWPGAQPAKWQINRNVYVTQSFDATDYIANFLLSH